MVAPAFGFSVGDFAAAIKLIGKAAKALRETTGANSQYQQAAIELETLHSVLRRVQSLQPTTKNADLVQKIQLCGLACQVPLSKFIKKIEKFEPYLGSQGASPSKPQIAQWASKSGRKIQWATILEKDLADLRASIAPQLEAIQILLQLESLERTNEFGNTTFETNVKAKEFFNAVSGLSVYIQDEVASQHQVESLQRLLEGLTLRTNQDSKDLISVVRNTKLSTERIEGKLKFQENVLQCIMQNISLPPIRNTLAVQSEEIVVQSDSTVCETQELSPRIESIATQLSSFVLAIRDGISEILIMMLCLLPAIRKILRSLTMMSRTPTLLLQDNIHLEDALGRMMSLPYEHFRYWPVLQARLQEAFTGLPGEDKVKQNQFHIMNMRAGGNLVLTKNSWSRAVFPGSQVAMSMAFMKASFVEQTCPRCQSLVEDAKDNAWAYCERCDLTYRTLERGFQQGVLQSQRSDHIAVEEDIMDGVTFISGLGSEITDGNVDSAQAMAFFKRVHLIGDRAKKPRTKVIHNAGGIVIRKDGRPSMRSPSSAINSRKGRERKVAERPEMKGISQMPARSLARANSFSDDSLSGEFWLNADYDTNTGTPVSSEFRNDDSLPSPSTSFPEWVPVRSSNESNSRRVPFEAPLSEYRPFEYGQGVVNTERVEREIRTDTYSQHKTGTSENRAVEVKPKSILKTPTQQFPEHRHPIREGVARTRNAHGDNIPPNARWTKIDRRLVNSEALEEARERFEERLDCVIVLRVLTREEIVRLANRTEQIRDERDASEDTA